jgi:acyl-CoA synthetase (AMP-forming)/AMP-acid ligase II/enoyl-CoA hydratase/carnithine racemase
MSADLVRPVALQEEYRRRGLWPQVTLAERVRAVAERTPDRLAVIDGTDGRQVTYRQLLDDASRVAGFLREQGIGAGNGVSVQLPNRYETVAVDVGVLLLGARLNPLLPDYRRHELRHILSVSRARAYFTPQAHRGFDHAGLADVLLPELPELGTHVVVSDDPAPGRTTLAEVLRAAPLDDVPDVSPAEVSELIFTSGTESRAKAVMHSEETLNASVLATVAHLGLTDEDVVWMPSPVGHSTGLNFGVRLALLQGLPVVLQDRWDPSVAARLVETHRPTYTLAATTFLSDLLRVAAQEGRDLSSLRSFGCGGAPVPAPLVRSASEAGIGVLRLYGSTEGLIMSWNQHSSPQAKREDTDGVRLPDVEVQVWDTLDEPVSAGTPGELIVRGPNVCLGFFDDPERTAASFTPDGWLRTGDIGALDEDDYVTIHGRKKEVIIRGGLNIAPREIEDLITQMPQVREVAVVGVPDERLGEVVCACVVPSGDAEVSLDEVAAFLRSRDLATYKLPQRLQLVDALPRTATGKIRKVELLGSADTPGMSTASSGPVLAENWEHEGVRGILLRLNRPELRNPLDHDTVLALLEHVERAEATASVRAVVITGSGSAFSAGGDLRKYLDLYEDRPRFSAFLDDFARLCDRLERGPLVSCAMVNGACVAGGLELALACDLITIGAGARIGDGHLGSGQLPGAGGSQRLCRAIGLQKAKELLLTGALWSAEQAAVAGLVTRIFADSDLERGTLDLVASCGRHSSLGYATMKHLITVSQSTDLDAGLDVERGLVEEYATTSHDAREGLHSFLERRPPSWTGA